MPKQAKRRKRPLGIFVYCTEEERHRLDRMRRLRHMTWTGYMLDAALHQAERDEAALARRGRPQ